MLPSRTDSPSAPPTWRQRGQALLQLALGPGGMPGANRSDQTLLLSGLLLTLIFASLLGTGVMLIMSVRGGGGAQYGLVSLAAAAVFGGAYALNRRGRYRLAALIAVGITSITIWASFVGLPGTPETDFVILAYLSVPLLLAGLLLPFWPTVVIAAGEVLVLLLVKTPDGVDSIFSPSVVIYLAIFTGLTLGMTALRERQLREIGERERDLAASVAQFKNAFEHARTGMALLAPDGHFLLVNRSLSELVGYSEAELQAMDFQSITHADDLQDDEANSRRLLAGEVDSFQAEKRYIHKLGHVVWINLSVSLVRDAQGQPLNFISQIEDISERKQAEDALRASEARFRTLSNKSPVGIYQTDAQGRAVYHNARWLEMTGLTADEALGDGGKKVVHPDDRDRLMAEWDRTIRENQPYATEFRFVDTAGQTHWASTSAAEIQGANGEIVGYVGTISDISESKISERKLKDANEAMQVWVSELEQRTREIGLLNELSSQLQSCLTAEEAYGLLRQMGPQLFHQEAGLVGVINPALNLVETVITLGSAAPGMPAFPPEDCWALRRGRAHWYEDKTGAVRCPHLGDLRPDTYLCVPMMAHGEALGVLHLQGLSASGRNFAQTVADNISLALANLNLRERLRDQSIRDVLTGLFNRRYLEETLERELKRAERENTPVGILMLDIDNFKRFNDSYGHAAGDEIMRGLGRILGRQVRVEDIACRYGGEEFTLVLPGCTLDAACRRAESLCAQLRDLRVPHGGQVLGGLTLSVGAAAFPQHGATGPAVLRAADAALYRAKKAGRNRVMPAAMAQEPSALPVSEGDPRFR